MTTVGELIAAAYAAADGSGPERLERAAALLTETSLTRVFSRRLAFTR